MSRPTFNVGVETALAGVQEYSTGDCNQAWATSVTVNRKGHLQIWEGNRARVFHPKGEWLAYTVRVAEVPVVDVTLESAP